MRHLVIAGLAVVLAAACSKDTSDTEPAATGLPAKGEVAMPKAMPGQMANPHGGAAGMADPHGGAAGMANPHGGAAGMANPHGGAAGMANPHGGMAMGAAPAQPVDPNMFLKGTITAAEATKAKVKPGAILYLAVKPINPITGDVIGGTLAVDRIVVDKLPIEFELTGANVMTAGAKFEGDVMIIARTDQDGEASTKQPGDVEGSVKAKVPAEGLAVSLDKVLE